MSTYTWPSGAKDEASVAGGRLAEQLRAKIGLVGMAFDTARDAALAELLASSSIGGGQTLEGDLLPDTDSAHDLGSTALRWADAWIDSLTLTTAVNFEASLGRSTGGGSTPTLSALPGGFTASQAQWLRISYNGVEHLVPAWVIS